MALDTRDRMIDEAATTIDGTPITALQARWQVPRVEAWTVVGSTMELAHAAARAGAPSGTVVVADQQTAGRGRNGRRWESPPGGAWCSMLFRRSIEQPFTGETLAVLTVRIGLMLAAAIDRRISPPEDSMVTLKWPNDLLLGGAKVGGILTDARWDRGQLDWLVIGVGLNRSIPALTGTDASRAVAALPATIARLEVLGLIVAAGSEAVHHHGLLTADELEAFGRRDALAGQSVAGPVAGRAMGIRPDGGLRIATPTGETVVVRSGAVDLALDAIRGETPPG